MALLIAGLFFIAAESLHLHVSRGDIMSNVNPPFQNLSLDPAEMIAMKRGIRPGMSNASEHRPVGSGSRNHCPRNFASRKNWRAERQQTMRACHPWIDRVRLSAARHLEPPLDHQFACQGFELRALDAAHRSQLFSVERWSVRPARDQREPQRWIWDAAPPSLGAGAILAEFITVDLKRGPAPRCFGSLSGYHMPT